jgi:hypothetical protein
MLELIQQLVADAGVSEEQAQGGAGLLFGLLKDKLSSGDFAQVAEAVPNVEDLVSAAPEGGSGLGGLLGGVVSSFAGSQAGNLASLAGGFSKLGLDPEMISKFVPVVLSFLESRGGEGLAQIVSKVLKGD